MQVLWNGRSGSAKANAALLHELQTEPNITVRFPDSAGDTERLAREACESGVDIVVAAGGDGTVNSTVQGIMHAGRSAVLGVLPLGTGNDFSRSLGMPQNPFRAFESIRTGLTRRVDVVRADADENSRYYINMATGGNTGRFMEHLTSDMKRFWGPLIYLRGVVDVLTDLVAFNTTIRFDDGRAESFEALNVFVANGRTSGAGLQVAPDANLEDGRLDVIVVCDCEPLEIAGLAADFALHDYRVNEHVVYRRAKSLTVSSEPAMRFTVDGELMTDRPVRFTVCPAAIDVVIGPTYGK